MKEDRKKVNTRKHFFLNRRKKQLGQKARKARKKKERSQKERNPERKKEK